MVQSNIFGTFANDVSSEMKHVQVLEGAKEIRPLNDLELTSIAGGDGVVCWTPAP